MFNMGMLELVVIGVLALIFIGPKQLPQVARVVGKMLGELKKASSDFQRNVYQAQDATNQSIAKVENTIDRSVNIQEILKNQEKIEDKEIFHSKEDEERAKKEDMEIAAREKLKKENPNSNV